jgi:hypothetical protein
MKFLDVAMADPTNLGVIDELRIRTQLNIRPYLAGPKMIERAIGKFYKRGFGRMYRRDVDVPMDTGDVISHIGPAPKPDGLVGRRSAPLAPTLPPPISGLDLGHAGPPALTARDAEIDALQERISSLEARVERDEQVLRKLLAILVEKNVATREEILERIR